MMMGQRWRLGALWSAHVLLLLVRASCCSRHRCVANALAGLVGGVVKKSTNVVNEEWVQEFGNFLLVGKIQSAIERDPVVCQYST